MQKSLMLTDPGQIEAFAAAKQEIAKDAEADRINAEMFQGDVKNGEVIRILADAYAGKLDLTADTKADEGQRRQ